MDSPPEPFSHQQPVAPSTLPSLALVLLVRRLRSTLVSLWSV